MDTRTEVDENTGDNEKETRVRADTRLRGHTNQAAKSGESGFRQPDDLLLDGVLHQLGFIMDVQFAHQIEFVSFYGLHAEFERCCDLLDRLSLSQHLENLSFSLGQRAKAWRARWAAASLHTEIVHQARDK